MVRLAFSIGQLDTQNGHFTLILRRLLRAHEVSIVKTTEGLNK
jgi:hypothetical protein